MINLKSVAGIDGCKAGWFVVTSDDLLANVESFVAPTIGEACERLTKCGVIGIDIPIGLPDSGSRSCDRLARQLLAPHRTSSVFTAPIRPVLRATSYQKACDLHEAIDGKRMSVQAFHILAKIREVDGFVRAKSAVAARVHEVHPELAFLRLNDGTAIAPPKRKSEGFELRLNLLTRAIPEEHIEKTLNAHSRKAVAKDDVLDALAVMLSARGIAAGKGTRLPQEPVQDAAGVDMAIWY